MHEYFICERSCPVRSLIKTLRSCLWLRNLHRHGEREEVACIGTNKQKSRFKAYVESFHLSYVLWINTASPRCIFHWCVFLSSYAKSSKLPAIIMTLEQLHKEYEIISHCCRWLILLQLSRSHFAIFCIHIQMGIISSEEKKSLQYPKESYL